MMQFVIGCWRSEDGEVGSGETQPPKLLTRHVMSAAAHDQHGADDRYVGCRGERLAAGGEGRAEGARRTSDQDVVPGQRRSEGVHCSGVWHIADSYRPVAGEPCAQRICVRNQIGVSELIAHIANRCFIDEHFSPDACPAKLGPTRHEHHAATSCPLPRH